MSNIGPKQEQDGDPLEGLPADARARIEELGEQIRDLQVPRTKFTDLITKIVRLGPQAFLTPQVKEMCCPDIIHKDEFEEHMYLSYEALLRGDAVRNTVINLLGVKVPEVNLEDGIFVDIEFHVLDTCYSIEVGSSYSVFIIDLNKPTDDMKEDIFEGQNLWELAAFIKTLSPLA